MTSLVIFVLPLLTAVAAWLLFLHLARSGRQVTYERWWECSTNVDPEALRLARERIRAMQTMFAQLGVSAAQATAAFNEFGRVLREALEQSARTNESATKAGASGQEET